MGAGVSGSDGEERSVIGVVVDQTPMLTRHTQTNLHDTPKKKSIDQFNNDTKHARGTAHGHVVYITLLVPDVVFVVSPNYLILCHVITNKKKANLFYY